jgi:hypothetical protein
MPDPRRLLLVASPATARDDRPVRRYRLGRLGNDPIGAALAQSVNSTSSIFPATMRPTAAKASQPVWK